MFDAAIRLYGDTTDNDSSIRRLNDDDDDDDDVHFVHPVIDFENDQLALLLLNGTTAERIRTFENARARDHVLSRENSSRWNDRDAAESNTL